MNKHYLPVTYPWPIGLCYLSITGCWRRISENNHLETEVVASGPHYSEFTSEGKHRQVHA